MTCAWKASTLLVLLVAGCPETNTFADEDAGLSGLDASLEELDAAGGTVDATATPDVFVCPDVDGDGETDARCGGTDCDDEDAMLSSTQGPCGTPTAIHRCVAGEAADIECTGETPYCDARIGACVANACGDGVRHANEFCETDDEVCSGCRQPCTRPAHCADDQVCRVSTTFSGRLWGACVPLNLDGAADGARCDVDDDCRSTYCDPYMGRCTYATDSCAGPDSTSELGLYTPSLPGGDLPFVCKYSCSHQSECRGGASCVLARTPTRPSYLIATCLPVLVGAGRFGESCARDTDCQSGICVSGQCTTVCRGDTDCGAPLTSCSGLDLTDQWFVAPRPSDWTSPWPLLCTDAS